MGTLVKKTYTPSRVGMQNLAISPSFLALELALSLGRSLSTALAHMSHLLKLPLFNIFRRYPFCLMGDLPNERSA